MGRHIPGRGGDPDVAARGDARRRATRGPRVSLPSAGFFAVAPRDGEASAPPLLHGATQQADPRESDFRTAGPADTVDEVRLELARRQSVADPFLPGWLAIVAAALLVAWGWKQTQRGKPAAGGTS